MTDEYDIIADETICDYCEEWFDFKDLSKCNECNQRFCRECMKEHIEDDMCE